MLYAVVVFLKCSAEGEEKKYGDDLKSGDDLE